MNTVIGSCLEVLRRQHDLLADAIKCLTAVAELDASAQPERSVTLEEVQEHFRIKPAQPFRPVPAKKPARPAKAASAPKLVPAAKRSGSDAVLRCLLNAKEPMRAVAISEALKLSYSAVNRALVQLEQRKHVVRSGSHIHTRWSLPTVKAAGVKPVNGTKTVKAEGVEFDVVYAGSKEPR